jgi:hypothetical protein
MHINVQGDRFFIYINAFENSCHVWKDGNKSGSDRVECLGTQNRNRPEHRFGWKFAPETKPADNQNPIGYSKPASYGNIEEQSRLL